MYTYVSTWTTIHTRSDAQASRKERSMGNISVYLPDALMKDVQASEINVSAVTQRALRQELERSSLTRWSAQVAALAPVQVEHSDRQHALDEAKADFGE